MFSRVLYTTLLVSDQDRALDFYTRNLGFQKRSDYAGPDGRFLTLRFEGQDLEVILWQAPKGRDGTPADGETAGPVVLDPGELFLESDDLRADFDTLRSRDVQFLEPAPEDYPFGVRVTALDPDGNRVSLRQQRR